MKYHFLHHFLTITKHRNQVIRNASHCGIFFHALKHDLTKYGPTEFITSAKYYAGTHSPVDEERRSNHYFSKVCQHHTRRNKHHWEYWTDFFMGRIVSTRCLGFTPPNTSATCFRPPRLMTRRISAPRRPSIISLPGLIAIS